MKVPPGTKDFDPTAHSHLAWFFDSVGHGSAASKVQFVREQKQRQAEYLRVRATQPRFTDFSRKAWRKDRLNFQAILKHWYDIFSKVIFGYGYGYGYAPVRAFRLSVAVVVFAAAFYGFSYSAGQMAPNSPVILISSEWQDAVIYGCPLPSHKDFKVAKAANCAMPLQIWELSQTIRDYETFDAIGYGMDLFIPLVDLGQERAWSPSKDRGWLGAFGFYLRWPIQLLGWVITAVAAATLTGLVGRED